MGTLRFDPSQARVHVAFAQEKQNRTSGLLESGLLDERRHDMTNNSASNLTIAILGCGAHAAVVRELCLACGFTVIAHVVEEGFSSSFNPNQNDKIIEIGSQMHLDEHAFGTGRIALAIGNNDARLRWGERLLHDGFELPILVHPKSLVSPSATLAPGTFIGAGAIVQTCVHIGMAGLINTGAIVEHHCVIGAGAHIAPGAILAGLVQVGDRALIGAGAVIRDRIVIGNRATVGAGSVVVHDVDAFSVVVGVPAKPIKQKAKM
jgi:sugar O-acyltransferase (sialic acid O-acetyltransferase NeuD family)